jgi:RHS repeat-associated protein
VQFGPAQTNDSVDGGYGYSGTGTFAEDRYFYHHDHLGSSSYLTNQLGNITQHVEYIPFGEVFVEERNDKWNTPYLFNGKELDEETGLYYYGARYYSSKESVWLSVDPLAEKYPDWSPYAYALLNPVKYVDPDGKIVRDPNGNIVFTATNNNAQYIQYYNTDQRTGITTVLYFNATEGKILTDKGNEVTVFRANSPDVYMAQIDANGNLISNNVVNQPFENGYNCTGNAMADQAFTISSDQITSQYLQDEGFVTLGAGQQTQAGDVGIYTDNASGIITHLEPFLTNNTVSTKGGIAVDQGPVAPGQSKQFSQGATYSVIRKTQPDQTVNVPNGATSNVNGGVNQVDNNTFNTIKQNLNP